MNRFLLAVAFLGASPLGGQDTIPATFVVGKDGRIKARFVDPDYRKRMTVDELLEALKQAN